ncbi:MAG: hypothetical protein AAGI91_07310 [Bacteroidota bacterium]
MKRLLFLPLLALAFAACDSGEDGPPTQQDPGSFSATVASSAGDSTAFSGLALASFNESATFRGITLAETGANETDILRSMLFSLTAPFTLAPGTYGIGDVSGDSASFAVLYSDFRTFPNVGFFAQSGTLTLETITEETMAGRFAFEGVGRSPDLGSLSVDYTARGTFEAPVTRPPED